MEIQVDERKPRTEQRFGNGDEEVGGENIGHRRRGNFGQEEEKIISEIVVWYIFKSQKAQKKSHLNGELIAVHILVPNQLKRMLHGWIK